MAASATSAAAALLVLGLKVPMTATRAMSADVCTIAVVGAGRPAAAVDRGSGPTSSPAANHGPLRLSVGRPMSGDRQTSSLPDPLDSWPGCQDRWSRGGAPAWLPRLLLQGRAAKAALGVGIDDGLLATPLRPPSTSLSSASLLCSASVFAPSIWPSPRIAGLISKDALGLFFLLRQGFALKTAICKLSLRWSALPGVIAGHGIHKPSAGLSSRRFGRRLVWRPSHGGSLRSRGHFHGDSPCIGDGLFQFTPAGGGCWKGPPWEVAGVAAADCPPPLRAASVALVCHAAAYAAAACDPHHVVANGPEDGGVGAVGGALWPCSFCNLQFFIMSRISATSSCLAAISAHTRLPTSRIMECWWSCFAEIPLRLPRISCINARISSVIADPDLDELGRETSEAASGGLGSASRAASS